MFRFRILVRSIIISINNDIEGNSKVDSWNRGVVGAARSSDIARRALGFGAIRRDSARFDSIRFISVSWLTGRCPACDAPFITECCNQRADLARPDRACTLSSSPSPSSSVRTSTALSSPPSSLARFCFGCNCGLRPTTYSTTTTRVLLPRVQYWYYYYYYYYYVVRYFRHRDHHRRRAILVTLEAVPNICQSILSLLLMVPLQLLPELRQQQQPRKKNGNVSAPSPFCPDRHPLPLRRHTDPPSSLPDYRRSLCLRSRWMTPRFFRFAPSRIDRSFGSRRWE